MGPTLRVAIVGTLILTGSPAMAQEHALCPIEFQKVDPHASPFSAGLFGTDKDPWDHYLRIEYKNASTKTIIAIRFGVAFVDAMAEADNSVYSYDSSDTVKPGKISKPFWGDGVYFNQYGYKMGAIAWLEKARFSDNTFFVDDGTHACRMTRGVAAAQVVSAPANSASANQGLDQVIKNTQAAMASPAAAASLANEGRVLNQQELAEKVNNGEASKCAIVTVPSGAEVYIDGNKLGVTPVAFVLSRHGDTPRTITIKMNGYRQFEKKVVPDGKTIPIGVTLEKQ